MKSAHLTSVHHPFDVRIFRKQCSALRAAGVDVVLVAPSDESGPVDGIPIRALKKPRNRFERMTSVGLQLFSTALKEKADVYHVHDPELLPWAQLLRMLGKTVIFDMHENVPKALLTKDWIPASLRRPVSQAYRAAERILLYKIPVVFAESSYRKNYPWVQASVDVLNMPLVSELAAISEDKFASPTVGYIGGVTPERGSLTMLAALNRLRQNNLNVHFECLGPIGPQHEAVLRECVEASRLSVNMPGRVSAADGWRIMARCHVGLAVLKALPNYSESYPTKMFEYMALGLPVVVTDVPLYRGIVDRFGCGICVDPDDADAIAAAIHWLVEHPREAEAMGARGRAAVLENFSWDNEFEKLKSFYQASVAS